MNGMYTHKQTSYFFISPKFNKKKYFSFFRCTAKQTDTIDEKMGDADNDRRNSNEPVIINLTDTRDLSDEITLASNQDDDADNDDFVTVNADDGVAKIDDEDDDNAKNKVDECQTTNGSISSE